jgi:hypothetical protein
VPTLPVRPSLQSLRKQAKQLQRAVAANEPDALARLRAQLPDAALPLTQRDAQLALAREYGFSGWQALRAEVAKRTGQGLIWAAGEAKRAIHADDRARLEALLAQEPALLGFRDHEGATLLTFAAEAFGPGREEAFTRRACAELLIERGAQVDPVLVQNVLMMRSRGMLELLASRRLLPCTLRVAAALGDLEGVRALAGATERAELHEACMDACAFGHAAVAQGLLSRCIESDPELGRRIDAGPGQSALLAWLAEHDDRFGAGGDLWQAYVVGQLRSAIEASDEAGFDAWLRREPWLLEDAAVPLQIELLELATYTGREPFIRRLLDVQPALLRQVPPPPSAAIEYAFEYGHASYVPLLARIWSVPDDLPHAAGAGDLTRVRRWFDADGQLALGEPGSHYPLDNPRKLGHLHWSSQEPQHVLDCAFAWACLNHQFEVAAFLLERGADIDCDWGTHEPASILHECAIQADRAAAQFLIDRGIDTSLLDHRWQSDAEGWARFGAGDAAMADFLARAARERDAGGAGAGAG